MLPSARKLLPSFCMFAVATALAASLSACAGAPQQTGPVKKIEFAAGWSEHAKPLFFHGMGRDPGYTIWQVPNNLPRGTYRVIERKSGPAGEMAELLDGQRFEVDAVNKDIFLNIETGHAHPEALDEKYIVGVDGVPAK